MALKRMNIVEYAIRTLCIVLSTIVRALAFLIHRIVSGNPAMTYTHVRSWSRRILGWAGVRLETVGLDTLDPSRSYIFVANHASLFDIPVLQCALPGNVRIMYKKELQKVPFMGWALASSSFVPIIREKARDALSTVQRTIDAIRSDDSSLIVFAEGTRTSDGKLQKFKRGAFMLAVHSAKPIVPVAIRGSFEVLPKTTLRFRRGVIRVSCSAPIEIESREYSREEEMALMKQVHESVEYLLQH